MRLSFFLLLVGLAGCASRARHSSGMNPVTVTLQGEPQHAAADAAVLNERLRRNGYTGEARARRGGIEVDFRLPGDLKPDRMLKRVLTPGQLGIRQEVALTDEAEVLSDCTAGPGACVEVGTGPARLTSAHVADATPFVDPTNNATAVVLTFTEEGSVLLERLTEQVVGLRLVVEVDGEVISRPLIEEPISNGTAVLRFGSQGLFARSPAELEALATKLVGRPLQSSWVVVRED